MTELVGPWVWDQIFAQRAGDPTQSPFGLIWHDQGMTSPDTSDTCKHMSKMLIYITHCMYPYVSQCLWLTCLLEIFFTVTTWLPRILQPGRDVVAHGRPYKTESTDGNIPQIARRVNKSFNMNRWGQARTGIKVVFWQR